MVGLCIAMAFVQKKNARNMYILYVQFLKSDVTLFFYDHMGMIYGETCLVFLFHQKRCALLNDFHLSITSRR